jgi:spermidine synthase
MPTGSIGQIFDAFWAASTPRTVAIVGLGAGSLSCYAAAEDQWDFYEIDPAVERIARNPQYFTYLRDCPAHKRVILGDARLSLAQAPDHRYGLIIFGSVNIR